MLPIHRAFRIVLTEDGLVCRDHSDQINHIHRLVPVQVVHMDKVFQVHIPHIATYPIHRPLLASSGPSSWWRVEGRFLQNMFQNCNHTFQIWKNLTNTTFSAFAILCIKNQLSGTWKHMTHKIQDNTFNGLDNVSNWHCMLYKMWIGTPPRNRVNKAVAQTLTRASESWA